VEHIYNKETGLGWDLDFVVPFAAINEGGRDISNIDPVSELAHRAMLTNLVRLLGKIKATKERVSLPVMQFSICIQFIFFPA
jgi:fatty acid synthase subunit alpha, fungi type